jgi:hypothetical protein
MSDGKESEHSGAVYSSFPNGPNLREITIMRLYSMLATSHTLPFLKNNFELITLTIYTG